MRFTLRVPDNEGEILREYSQKTKRNKTDVLREYIRTLSYRLEKPLDIDQKLASNVPLFSNTDSRNQKTLLMTVGLPRSGKSTWARCQSYPIVCPDAIRMALYGQPFIRTAESIIWAHAKLMVASLFEAGHDTVILDATNTMERYRSEWIDNRWECKYVMFSTDADECIRRAITSNQQYLLPVIQKMADNFEYPELIPGKTIWVEEYS